MKLNAGIKVSLAAAAVVAAVIAPTVAVAKTERAKFKLSLNGEQKTTLLQTGSCHEERSEQVSFATPRPQKVTLKTVRTGGLKHLWFAFGPGGPRGLGEPTLRVEADVERRVALTGPEGCFAEPDQPPEQDCARAARGLDWWLHLSPGADPSTGLVATDRIALFNDYGRDQSTPFPIAMRASSRTWR